MNMFFISSQDRGSTEIYPLKLWKSVDLTLRTADLERFSYADYV